jgi:hypothetical protein
LTAVLKGHDFSRADSCPKLNPTLVVPIAAQIERGFSRADTANRMSEGFKGCGKTQLDRRFEGARL